MRQAVLDHTPSGLGLSGQLWTRRQIGRLIFRLYGVRFTEPGVGKYLKRWGLTFQRPDKRAVEQDPEAVRTWHEETWPAIYGPGRRLMTARSCSPTRSGSARIRSSAAPGAPAPCGRTRGPAEPPPHRAANTTKGQPGRVLLLSRPFSLCPRQDSNLRHPL
ncbi:helix-turn-helix domain-containing protein [Streptomyces mutabilis]